MDTKEGDKFGTHLVDLVNREEASDTHDNSEISFGPGHSFFQPPSFSRALVAQDLCTPDLRVSSGLQFEFHYPHLCQMQQTLCSMC